MSSERGPEAVRAALIDAAADLFSEAGDVSVRAIASRAGVNHGLVHHYFGSKEGLRRAVLEHLSQLQAAQMSDEDLDDPWRATKAAVDAARANSRFFRVLARALLDGESPKTFQSTFPVVKKLVRSLERASVEDAQVRVAEGLATSLGWLLFEPWIRRATGLSKRRSERLLDDVLARQVAAYLGNQPS